MAGLIRRGLEREGIAVDLAGRGEDALWRAESVDYVAIVLDLMLTARESVRDRVAGLDRGADDYLTNPSQSLSWPSQECEGSVRGSVAQRGD